MGRMPSCRDRILKLLKQSTEDADVVSLENFEARVDSLKRKTDGSFVGGSPAPAATRARGDEAQGDEAMPGAPGAGDASASGAQQEAPQELEE
eukprot:6155854-Pyramimonas_sp.AAC.1